MRITGGQFRGRSLTAPPDARVRPTSDKVRQAVFNILQHNDFGVGFALEGARVCDLFAGTGALGLEALSHGASFALLVDDSAESRGLIRSNVEALQLTGATKIWRRDATDLGPMAAGSGGPFELAFLDPPYRKDLAPRALAALRDGGWLTPNAVIVCETAEDETIPAVESFHLESERTYGDTRVRFYTKP
ncbi:MAG TPA: 16S rRNA (guanine(966)-N(2))-methyltransferase RsmD [Rhizomicrobium sp.]|nr:16S rRNA (guanine(966)-N(2))-methyltransferase RsmD [Rhizomicrobium sp.]